MAEDEVDAVVVGMGPGGEDVAGRLATAGLRVVGVDNRLVGGECPYFACVPTKMMVRGAGALAEAGRVPLLAGTASVRPDWTPVADRIRDEATTDWDDRVAVRRFEDTGGRFVRGLGRLTAPGEVTVTTAEGDRVFRPRRAIVLNPGTDPAVPPIDGLRDTPFWTNREAVRAHSLPGSMVVLGAGPVGMEFAQVFARFGVDTTVVEAAPRVLPGGEPEASESITEVFTAEGITVHTGTSARHVGHHDGRFTVELDSGESPSAEQLLVATGRRTDLAALGVGSLGLDETANIIAVDERMRAADGVWAIGDVTGHGAFTHTSVYQARIAADDILGDGEETADYRAMPGVAFTDPEVASLGLTEDQARRAGFPVHTAITGIPSSARGWIHKAGNEGLIKLVADTERDILLGATVVAPLGGEILGAFTVAVHTQVHLAQLRRMIFAYPTFHRAIEAALDQLVD
ncbi:Pyruvate/2-oxoglutarate dehydrogenase complex, dihydrolipoamide dehydrogenase (E3) component [Actinopolyspora lacussalsi subsp. righensis]|uniref:Pyruvate/2-oxoglutarate dehydrogenase complex, dihydrolipoamide dehydrogenase (E3) component n=1 Tax=Actinopolyspora righensis TaxID=995060 RepID=A0A1I7A8S3_9ACTN|nr:NAD(P)/FAD-dependent oxidoreductase [Actinopolyspora righensis]SFT71342.1 Pyruvate/2-oxoglutarate dehydrogenase complex, dihydrolipoamide dehydrogenase (E3) component [Actinopolyspora righensis]